MSGLEVPPDPPMNLAEWDHGQLRLMARQLLQLKESAPNERQRSEIERTLSHCAFELWWRDHWEPAHCDVSEVQLLEINQ